MAAVLKVFLLYITHIVRSIIAATNMFLQQKEEHYCFHCVLLTITFSSTFLLVLVLLQRDGQNVSKTGGEQMDVNTFLKLVNTTNGGPRLLLKAVRAVRITAYKNLMETAFLLSLPADRTLCNIDTSKWTVDKDNLYPSGYYYNIAEALFYSNAMELSRDSNATVLMVGLGGGLINGFLHHNFPKMNITVVELSVMMVYLASKWGDLILDDHQTLVLADGVKFIEEQVQKGVSYDAVILDACYSDKKHNQMCPVDSFLDQKVIQAMSRLVTNTGIVVINSFPNKRNSTDESKFLSERFQRFFKHCRTRKTEAFNNRIFYCMHQAESEEKHIDIKKFMSQDPLTSVQL